MYLHVSEIHVQLMNQNKSSRVYPGLVWTAVIDILLSNSNQKASNIFTLFTPGTNIVLEEWVKHAFQRWFQILWAT